MTFNLTLVTDLTLARIHPSPSMALSKPLDSHSPRAEGSKRKPRIIHYFMALFYSSSRLDSSTFDELCLEGTSILSLWEP